MFLSPAAGLRPAGVLHFQAEPASAPKATTLKRGESLLLIFSLTLFVCARRVWLLADLTSKEFCKYVRIVPRTGGMLANCAALKRG